MVIRSFKNSLDDSYPAKVKKYFSRPTSSLYRWERGVLGKEVTYLVKRDEELKPRSPESDLGSLQHVTLLQTHFLCFPTNTAPNCLTSYSLKTLGPPLCQIHSNAKCKWSAYYVPNTKQVKSHVLSLIHSASFQGRHECPHWKRRRLMFRDLKKLAEVMTSKEKPGFDTGLRDSNKSLSLHSTATCSHTTLPSQVTSPSRTSFSFTLSAKALPPQTTKIFLLIQLSWQ